MDTCVCCGAPVPEGSQVCWECINYVNTKCRNLECYFEDNTNYTAEEFYNG